MGQQQKLSKFFEKKKKWWVTKPEVTVLDMQRQETTEYPTH